MNEYDIAPEAKFINTYVPIDFANLYQIGKAQNEAVGSAMKDMQTHIQKLGDFQSPSDVDTKRYYDVAFKDINPLISQYIENPDRIKDAAFRSSFYGALNSVDRAELSRLEQSREGMLARQKFNQELIAKGLYNPLLHDIDFTSYDTSKNGIFNDTAPLGYKSVREMVEPYVNNLKPEFIKRENGYIFNGITEERTEAQVLTADGQVRSDITNTPWYAQNLEVIKRQNPGISDADAREILRGQIITAAHEHKVDPTITPDTVWLEQWKLAHQQTNPRSHNNSGSGNNEELVLPVRQELLSLGASSRLQGRNLSPEGLAYYEQYLTNAGDTTGLNNLHARIDSINSIRTQMNGIANDIDSAKKAGNEKDLNKYIEDYKKQKEKLELQELKLSYAANRGITEQIYTQTAGFGINIKPGDAGFSNAAQNDGIRAALASVTSEAGLTTNGGDPLLTLLHSDYKSVTDSDGTTQNVYNFDTSKGFILPETAFATIIENGSFKKVAKRLSGAFRSNSEIDFRKKLESGQLKGVQFIPDNGYIQPTSTEFALSGKLRIPVSEIENAFGTGIGSSNIETISNMLYLGAIGTFVLPAAFGRQSTRSVLDNTYGLRKVTEIINGDKKEFYEFDSYRLLPDIENNPDYWTGVNTIRGQSIGMGTTGGNSFYPRAVTIAVDNSN